MKKYLYPFTLSFLLVIGCTTQNKPQINTDGVKPQLTLSQVEAWTLMTGTWFGSQPTKNGGHREWIVIRDKTGAYQITFRFYDQIGNYEESIEVGEWGISGPIYFSIYKASVSEGKLKPVDSSDPYNRDTYKIVSLTEKEFICESFSTGNQFTLKKVEDNYSFPVVN